MKVALIFPKRQTISMSDSKTFSFHPLVLSTIAAITPKWVDLDLIDENFEDINYANNYDLVGISVMTAYAYHAYEIAAKFRKSGTKVVMGGYHVSALPEETLKHCDSIVVGEAEGSWEKLLSDYKQSKLKPIYKTAQQDLSKMPLPDRKILKNKGYKFFFNVQTSRGCPQNCDFCSVTNFFGNKYRYRKISDVIKEIDELPHTFERFVWFCDDNIVGNIVHAKKFFKELISLKVRWTSCLPVQIAEDKELLDLIAKSGCISAMVGFESISDKSLREINKPWAKPKKYDEAIKKIRAAGIGIIGLFVFGFDHDDKSIFERTLEFADKHKFDACQFTALTPFPGTKLFEKFKNEGRLLHENWNMYDCGRVVFRPKLMEPEELEQGLAWLYNTYYSTIKSLRRLLSVGIPRLPSFLKINLGFRQMVKELNNQQELIKKSELSAEESKKLSV